MEEDVKTMQIRNCRSVVEDMRTFTRLERTKNCITRGRNMEKKIISAEQSVL